MKPRTSRLTFDDLLALAREHRPRGQALKELFDRRRNINAEADAEIEQVKADPSPAGRAYKLLGQERHRADARRIATEKIRLIEPHVSRALFEARHHHGRVQQALDAFELQQREPPTMEQVVLAFTGKAGMNIDQMLMASLLEHTALRNIREQVRAAGPSERLTLYREAIERFDPVANVVLRVLEKEKVPYPADSASTPEEAAAAVALGRAIAEAQAARVPDVSAVRAILDEVGRTLHTAELSGVRPVNPAHPTLTQPEPLPAAAAAGAE